MSSQITATQLHLGDGPQARLHERLSVSMRSSVSGKRGQMVARTEKCASLSVVVLSMGTPTDTRRATHTLGLASRDLGAQLIVVSHHADPALAKTLESTGAEFVLAPPGSSRAEMCDMGMHHARGAIVVVRDDAAVSDAKWLDTYRAVLARGESRAQSTVEAVAMDSQVVRRVARADAPESFSMAQKTAGAASLGIGAAV